MTEKYSTAMCYRPIEFEQQLFCLIVRWKRAIYVGFPCVIETLLPLKMSQTWWGMWRPLTTILTGICPRWRLDTTILTSGHILSLSYPEIPCSHFSRASQLKDHLTFIPAFAVEATVKQSSAFAFATKIHRSGCIFHTRGSNWFAVHPSDLPQKSMTWEYAQDHWIFGKREYCDTCTADYNTPFQFGLYTH